MPGHFSEAIVSWYRLHARDLPWRRKPHSENPYAIWVSEMMLQQTQVKTVIPYWERWMALFPGVRELAAAPEDRVLKAWEGLGYYRRARFLHRAAKILVEQKGGRFPSSFDEVLALPGVGRYTAGAVCSIAFGLPAPILDGNVERVLSRLYLLSSEKDLWTRARELVETSRDCSAFNQGLMELGATICTPRDPACPQCPLHRDCTAHLAGRVHEFPPATVQRPPRQRKFVALVLRDGERVLVRQRPRDLVNGGLWEFPNFEAARRPALGVQIENFLGSALPLEEFATIRHTITNNRITLKVFIGVSPHHRLARQLEAKWFSIGQLQALPFPSAHAKIRARLAIPLASEKESRA